MRQLESVHKKIDVKLAEGAGSLPGETALDLTIGVKSIKRDIAGLKNFRRLPASRWDEPPSNVLDLSLPSKLRNGASNGHDAYKVIICPVDAINVMVPGAGKELCPWQLS